MKLGLIAHKVHRRGGMERAAAEVMERIARRHQVVILARECEAQAPRLTFRPVDALPRPNVLTNWSFRHNARHSEKRLGLTLTNAIGASALDADVITAQFCHAAFHASHGGLRGGGSRPRRAWQEFVEGVFTRQEQAAYRSPRLKRVIAVSHGIKRELMTHYGVDGDKIVVIPNGVDHAVFKPASTSADKRDLRRGLGLPEDAFLCLFVGGDWDRKGLADAIRAVAGLPKAALAVVGLGDVDRFGALVREAGAAGRVFFVGRSPRPQDYYAAADAFTFPSRYEAFSLVTLEAAASGLPILARRINGTEELIEDGVNGFFLDGLPASLGEKIGILQQDPARLGRMSEAALESSRRYTWDRVAAEQLAVFEEAAP